MIIAPLTKTNTACHLCESAIFNVLDGMNSDYEIAVYDTLSGLNADLMGGHLLDTDFVIMSGINKNSDLRALAAYGACLIDVKHYLGPAPTWLQVGSTSELQDAAHVGDLRLWGQHHAWVSMYTQTPVSPASRITDLDALENTIDDLFNNHLPPSWFPPPLIYSKKQTGIVSMRVCTRPNTIYGTKE